MFDAKTIRLAESLRPDLDFSVMGTEEFAILKIVENASGGGVVPIYDADITNGIATFDGVTRSKPLVSLKLNIPVTQTGNGTPSPDNIRDFIGFGGVDVSRTGKNLWGGEGMLHSFIQANIPNATVDVTNNKITFSASNVHNVIIKGMGQFKQKTQYTLIMTIEPSNNVKDSNLQILYSNGVYSYINLPIAQAGLKQRFVVKTDANRTFVGFKGFWASGNTTIYCDECCVLEGDKTIDDFVPYTGNTYQITFGQTVYSANLDVLNGKLYLIDEIKTIDENTSIAVSNGIFAIDNFFEINNDTESVYCNTYQRGENRTNTAGVMNNNPDYSFCCRLGSTPTRVMIKDTRFTSTEDYKTWLSTNPVKIAVKLAEPIEIDLTPTVINTLIGENVIFADVADVTECKFTRK